MKDTRAFTLMELLVVMPIVGILAALLLPALSRAKQKALQSACQNNVRQIQLGWIMYAGESGDRLAYNSCNDGAGENAENPGWVAGDMWLDSDYGENLTESTNTDLLVGSQYAAFGSIGGFVKNAAVYRCPSDRSTVTMGGQPLPRVRSVSMNSYMGTGDEPGYKVFHKLQDLTKPGPSDAWVFMDEREDSINDGLFAVDPEPIYAIIDYPATYHLGGSSITFADGHAEYHRWFEATTNPRMVPGQRLPGGIKTTSPTDRDMQWLTAHTTSAN